MALELNHDHILAEAKRAAVETKRLCPRRDPSQTSKRIFVGWGMPSPWEARRGDAKPQLQSVLQVECFLSSSVEFPLNCTLSKTKSS